MSHNVQGVMAKCSNLWMKINSSPILNEKFNEYNKFGGDYNSLGLGAY
jgi:hypothetical protein